MHSYKKKKHKQNKTTTNHHLLECITVGLWLRKNKPLHWTSSKISSTSPQQGTKVTKARTGTVLTN